MRNLAKISIIGIISIFLGVFAICFSVFGSNQNSYMEIEKDKSLFENTENAPKPHAIANYQHRICLIPK